MNLKSLEAHSALLLAGTTIIVSFVAQWAVFGIRLSTVEQRQDRQSTTITTIQSQLQTQATDSAQIKAKLDALSETVNYIRDRIDKATTK